MKTIFFIFLVLFSHFKDVFLFKQYSFLPIIKAPIYDIDLRKDLSYSWQVDHNKNEIIVEVKHVLSIKEDLQGM